jgi:thiol-disulfide isomerase/thioredoxin
MTNIKRLFIGAPLTRECLVLSLLISFGATATVRANEEPNEKPKGENQKAVAAGSETPDPSSREPSSGYVHRWIGMPALTGHDLITGDLITVKPETGKVLVVMFLASFCEPCQNIIDDVRKLAARYQPLHTEFVYVFVHETKDDALGFIKEYDLKNGLLANHDILKTFKNPTLPTIYVSDRHGWMATRYTQSKREDLAKLDDFLKYITAY